MSEKIEIIIDTDGAVETEAHGFTGQGCVKAIQKLLAGLGRQADEKRKPEFYRAEQTTKVRQGR